MNEALTTDLAPSVSGAVPSATGITAPSNPARQGAFLTDVIVELGFAEPSAVQQALTATHQSAKTPERFLLDSGVIDEWQLSLAVAERNGLGHVDLDQFEVDVEVAGLIDGPTASRYAALPIAFDTDGALLVAIEDPFNMLGISDIEVMTRNEVRPLIATGTQIQSLIKKLPAPERPVVAELPEPPPAPTTEPNGWPGAGSEDSPQPESESELTPKPMLAQSAEPAPAEQASALAEERAEFERERQQSAGRQRELEGELATARAESQDAETRAEQAAASALAEERAEFKRERQQSADRQRELEGELATSQESITSLEGRVFKLTDAADLAKSATKKLAKLQERERELEGELATAQECITSLAKRASKLADAADLAKSATKKLAKLQDVLQMADQSKAP
ncbi:MAG TPA: hypothetical protein VND98_02640 [Solirubrobacterales bacterium]|nr:hypothetical protein [Solirubrobacterales bacterium]